MKKKSGFTLIELLAVIVILAVIAIITIPLILGVIEKSKKSSFKNSLYGILDSVDYYLIENNINDIPSDGLDIKLLNIKNNHIKYGMITGNIKEPVIVGMSDGIYCAYGTKKNLTINKGNCDITAPSIPKFIDTSNNEFIIETYELANDKESGIQSYECYYGLNSDELINKGKINNNTCEIPFGEEWYAKICAVNYAGITSCSVPKKIVNYLIKDGKYITDFTEVKISNKTVQKDHTEYSFIWEGGRAGLFTTTGFLTKDKPNIYVDLEISDFKIDNLSTVSNLIIQVGAEDAIYTNNVNIHTTIATVNASNPTVTIPRKTYEVKANYPYDNGILTISRNAAPGIGTFKIYNIWLQY